MAQAQTPSLRRTYAPLMDKFGVQVDFKRFTVVKLLPDAKLRLHKEMVTQHTAFLFTNKVAIDGFFKLVAICSISLPDTTKYFLATEALQHYLQKYIEVRKRRVFCGKKGIEELFSVVHRHAKDRFLFPCSKVGKPALDAFFKEKGYCYAKILLYHNEHCNLKGMDPSRYGVIVFFSPLAVQAFFNNFPGYTFGATKIAAFGQQTVQALHALQQTALITVETARLSGIVAALDRYFQGVSDAGCRVVAA